MRLVATDLDGTLLRTDGTVSERTRHALAATRRAGIDVVVVTARSPRWLLPVVDELGVEGHAICSNGAVVYDLGARRVARRHPLATKVAQRLIRSLRDAAPGVAFACEREDVGIREPAYEPLWPSPDEHPRLDAIEAVAQPVLKLTVQHPELEQADLHRLASELCGLDAVATYSGRQLVEISAAGVTKAFAVEQLCSDLGVPAREVIAFGDMPNDVPLLEWSGHSVAVANAHPDVLAVADEITASNEEDGVALVLERLAADGAG